MIKKAKYKTIVALMWLAYKIDDDMLATILSGIYDEVKRKSTA